MGGGGHELSLALSDNQQQLKDKKSEVKKLSNTINSSKREIDRIKSFLESKKQERGEVEDVIDDEEYTLYKQLKEHKASYRSSYDELKVVKGEVEYISRLVVQVRVQLVQGFEQWFAGQYLDETPTQDSPRGGEEEVLDDGEKFELLEMEKIMNEDPEAVSFYNARKQAKSNKTLRRRV